MAPEDKTSVTQGRNHPVDRTRPTAFFIIIIIIAVVIICFIDTYSRGDAFSLWYICLLIGLGRGKRYYHTITITTVIGKKERKIRCMWGNQTITIMGVLLRLPTVRKVGRPCPLRSSARVFSARPPSYASVPRHVASSPRTLYVCFLCPPRLSSIETCPNLPRLNLFSRVSPTTTRVIHKYDSVRPHR